MFLHEANEKWLKLSEERKATVLLVLRSCGTAAFEAAYAVLMAQGSYKEDLRDVWDMAAEYHGCKGENGNPYDEAD